MRTDLDHLPPQKQRELERVVRLLFEEFEDATKNATGKTKDGRILKIVLYGSYTSDRWVDEPYTAKGYQSDYDLLIIVDQNELTDTVAYWHKANDRLIREYGITHALRTPVNFIVHTLQEVNDALAHGRYFFMDIAKEGIALYQSDDRELHKPRPKTPKQSVDMAREYFEEWYSSAGEFYANFEFTLSNGRFKNSAFQLHQSTERLYHCVLLVCTFYTPHVHNLEFLRKKAESLDIRVRDVWPSDSRADRAKFEKLKEAYVKARYSKHYKISEEELRWLGERVEQLGQVVLTICKERIDLLEAAAISNDK
ncbi:HEPN domain-containing protein [Sphingobium naphthae]|nr:HEPN domain-containing protein [Sphingobium naphthae]